MTTKAGGGHPLDAIPPNGVPVSVPSQSTARFDLSASGSCNVRVNVASRMGATASKTSNGTINDCAWSVNAAPVTLSAGASWTANIPLTQVWPAQIDVVATDDGGLPSTGSVTVP